MKTKFKSVRPVKVTHERGTSTTIIEGEVTKIENDRVYLKGLIYDFSISKNIFEKYNISSN